MTDGQFLLLVFTLLYLFECLRWIPGRAVLWTQARRENEPGAWQSRAPLRLFRTRGGAFGLLPPLPPLGAHLVTAAWPCVPHEQGLSVWDDESGTAIHLPWSEVKASAEESVLHLSPHHRVRCIHGWQAAEWAGLIQQWKGQTQPEREQSFLARAASMLDRRALEEPAGHLAKVTRPLRRKGMVILAWTFLVLPFTYWRFGDTLPTLAAVAGLYLLMIWQALSLWSLARKEPRLKVGRWSHLLGAAFYPPSSIRVADWVCAMECPEVHPLLAAFVLGEREAAEKLAAQAWRLARWPVGDFPQRPWNGPEVQALELFFKEMTLNPASLEASPAPSEGAERHCPRCLATFSAKAEACPDCGGMPLVTTPQTATVS